MEMESPHPDFLIGRGLVMNSRAKIATRHCICLSKKYY